MSLMFGLLVFTNFVFQKIDNQISTEITLLEDKLRDVLKIKNTVKSLAVSFNLTPKEKAKLDMLDVIEELSKRFEFSVLEDFMFINNRILSVKVELKSNQPTRDELYYLFSLLNRQDMFFILEKLSVEKSENGSSFRAVLEIKSIVK